MSTILQKKSFCVKGHNSSNSYLLHRKKYNLRKGMEKRANLIATMFSHDRLFFINN